MTLEMIHKNSKASVCISNNHYEQSGQIEVTGDWFLAEYFNAYFNKQLTDEWGMGDGIPEKFKQNGKLIKHIDDFFLEYFIPLYEEIYEILIDKIKD